MRKRRQRKAIRKPPSKNCAQAIICCLSQLAGKGGRRTSTFRPVTILNAQPQLCWARFSRAAMTGEMMVSFTGLNETSDAKGFIVVYPDGTGLGPILTETLVDLFAESEPPMTSAFFENFSMNLPTSLTSIQSESTRLG